MFTNALSLSLSSLRWKQELNVLSERITISLIKSAKAPAREAENQAPSATLQATAPLDRNLAEHPEYQKLLEKVFRIRRERLRFSALRGFVLNRY